VICDICLNNEADSKTLNNVLGIEEYFYVCDECQFSRFDEIKDKIRINSLTMKIIKPIGGGRDYSLEARKQRQEEQKQQKAKKKALKELNRQKSIDGQVIKEKK